MLKDISEVFSRRKNIDGKMNSVVVPDGELDPDNVRKALSLPPLAAKKQQSFLFPEDLLSFVRAVLTETVLKQLTKLLKNSEAVQLQVISDAMLLVHILPTILLKLFSVWGQV